MKASLALLSLLTAFTSHSLKSPAVPPTVVQIQANTNLAIADGARQQIGSTLFYDPAYMQLTYPGGDVPQERGVCSDVVIRALRSQKVDLQKLVHEDMAKNFAEQGAHVVITGRDQERLYAAQRELQQTAMGEIAVFQMDVRVVEHVDAMAVKAPGQQHRSPLGA